MLENRNKVQSVNNYNLGQSLSNQGGYYSNLSNYGNTGLNTNL